MDNQPKTAQQFMDCYQIGRAKFYELVKNRQIKVTYITPRNPRILPADEQAFLESRRTTTA